MKAKKPWILTLCALAWAGFIFSRSAQDAPRSAAESGWLLELVQRVLPWMYDGLLRKLAHFGEFLILGGLITAAVRAFGKPAVTLPLLLGLLAALCDETIQFSAEGRAPLVLDVWIDFGGVVLAVTAAGLLRLLLRKRQNRRNLS